MAPVGAVSGSSGSVGVANDPAQSEGAALAACGASAGSARRDERGDVLGDVMRRIVPPARLRRPRGVAAHAMMTIDSPGLRIQELQATSLPYLLIPSDSARNGHPRTKSVVAQCDTSSGRIV